MSPSYQILSESLVGEFDLEPDSVHPQATLESLRLDSLALVELSLMLEERLGVTVTDVPRTITLAELASLVDAEAASAGRLVQAGGEERA